jgi:NADPH:quinone reductase-like Zn-dependent oxidoreductase
MRAAVLHEPSGVPRAESFPDPQIQGDEVSVRMLAAGLHQLVRIHAGGVHYSSHGTYPLVPGVDGVAELPDGRHAYVSWPRPPYGTFAERAAISPARAIALPAGLAPEIAAAIVNPASSGWLALRLRARLQPGESVLVLGATGASGQLAVQNARVLGAGRVIACGRNAHVLGKLGADLVLRVDAPELAGQIHRELVDHGIDVVLDYLWGTPAAITLEAILAARGPLSGHRIRYVNIGQSAGGHIQLSPHVLRSTQVELLGSGIGSVTPTEMAREIPPILEQAARGALTIDVEAVPLARVEEAWQAAPEHGRRVVIVP